MNLKIILFLVWLSSAQAFCLEKSVFILNSTDIHSMFNDRPDAFGRTSNLLRLSSLIQKKKDEIGSENLLLIDCGDILQGTFEAMSSEGETGIIFLRHNSYDVWIPGNHDFDFGFARFEELAGNVPNIASLAINIKSKHCSPWKIFTRNGIKIAVIGVGLPYLKSFGLQMNEIELNDVEESLNLLIPDVMKKSPNAIILAIHQGIFAPKSWGGCDLAKIARKFPQINLILAGHSHEDIPGKKIGNSTWFVQAGCHAKTLAEIKMLFDEKSGRFLDIQSKLIDLTKENKKDEELEKLLSEIMLKAKESASEIIGETATFIPSVEEGVINCEIHELISSAICATVETEIAFSGVGTRYAGFNGKIRRGQIFELLPYQDNVCTLTLSPEQFKSILDEQNQRFNPRHFHMPWGLYCESGSNSKIILKNSDGEEWTEGKKRIAFSSFALSGAGGRFPVLANFAKEAECELRDSGIKVRDAVIAFIKKKSPIKIIPKQWIINVK